MYICINSKYLEQTKGTPPTFRKPCEVIKKDSMLLNSHCPGEETSK
jgi:hypothetical protein